tara:strand:+ start:145 stop:489 length:345 start_codon:yes stop_codon:yes gene_type:complete
MSKNTLNIYEVLELLNEKINSNTSLIESSIEKINSDTQDSISEVKSYLLEKLKSDIEDTQKSIKKRIDRFKVESNKTLDKKQRKLVSDGFTNLQNNVSRDMENLVERIMNSRIL